MENFRYKVWQEVLGKEDVPTRLVCKTDVVQCILELEEAPMNSLSPQLQQLEQGFEEIPLDARKPMGIERRVNTALHEGGGEEKRIKLVYSDWKLDRSTTPPTRVVKTDKDRLEGTTEREKYLADLKKRKPRLYAQALAILAEAAQASDPIGSPNSSQSYLVS